MTEYTTSHILQYSTRVVIIQKIETTTQFIPRGTVNKTPPEEMRYEQAAPQGSPVC